MRAVTEFLAFLFDVMAAWSYYLRPVILAFLIAAAVPIGLFVGQSGVSP